MQALTTRIQMKDAHGNQLGDKEVATYAGLLAKAHEEGLCAISTHLLQAPAPDNGEVAIVEATVTTAKGTFGGLGDAAPGNVNRRIVPHLIRMAETRAKARALRDAVNIGLVAFEELGGEDEAANNNPPPAPAPLPRPTTLPPSKVRPFPQGPDRRAPTPEARSVAPTQAPQPRTEGPARMTENQRRWLFRFLASRGFEGVSATDALCKAAEVERLDQISKADASGLIDVWKAEEGNNAG